jgi:alpha-D-xyloside xylohydrolase
MQRLSAALAVFAGIILTTNSAIAQNPSQRLEIDRKGETIVLEPYAPNILRVTLSLKREPALAAPGYGFVGAPAADGWSATRTAEADVYQSARIVATVDRDLPPAQSARCRPAGHCKYFNGSAPGAHITLRTPEGKTLLELTGWSQSVPNHKDGTADVAK